MKASIDFGTAPPQIRLEAETTNDIDDLYKLYNGWFVRIQTSQPTPGAPFYDGKSFVVVELGRGQ